MSGPAIRSLAFARNLSIRHEVTLVAGATGEIQHRGFDLVPLEKKTVCGLAERSDLIVCQGEVLDIFPFLYRARAPLVVDLYDPLLLELLEIWPGLREVERVRLHRIYVRRTGRHLQAGDFFICASERQRDFWMGMLAASGRVNPYTYSGDVELRRLIDVVPFGLPEEEPVHSREVLKGVRPGIAEKDKVLLWNGGIWNWLDPITLVKAMKRVVSERQDVKLFFMGTKHPSPRVPEMEVCAETIRLTKEMGLLDEYVYFNEWTPYDERSSYLLEADFGVCLHREHLETRYSFRTRVLDCVWVGLPIIISDGDSMSELVREKDLGAVVPPGDEAALAGTILRLVDDPDAQRRYRANLKSVAPGLRWEAVLKPLAGFCERPERAPDRKRASDLRFLWLKYYAGRTGHYYREGGVREVARALLRRMRKAG